MRKNKEFKNLNGVRKKLYRKSRRKRDISSSWKKLENKHFRIDNKLPKELLKDYQKKIKNLKKFKMKIMKGAGCLKNNQS